MNFAVCFPSNFSTEGHVVAHRTRCYQYRRPDRNRLNWRDDFETIEEIDEAYPNESVRTVYGCEASPRECGMSEHFDPVPPHLKRSAH